MFLDGLQAVLGIVSVAAWLIPPPAGSIIAIATDVVDAVISVSRGDMIGARLAVCGVIGAIAEGTQCLDKASSIGKAFNKANDELNSVGAVKQALRIEKKFGKASRLALIYNFATSGIDIVLEGLRDGWTQEYSDRKQFL